jgi:CRISPR/Cas system CSM-associated protein Csm4 (group 5 of RAMP superfamily)
MGLFHTPTHQALKSTPDVVPKPTKKSIISGDQMNTNRKTSKKVVRVVVASAFRRLDRKVNREKKQCKALRRMRTERDDE